MNKLVLGVVQAITEFLPVSSSGHLVFLKDVLGLDLPGASYEVFLHTATFISVMVVLLHEGFKRKYVFMGFLGCIPLVFTLPFIGVIEDLFTSTWVLPMSFGMTSVFLMVSRLPGVVKAPDPMSSVIMGLAQVLALIPGVSRSGTTISIGILTGLETQEAFKVSFWMFVFAMSGAIVLKLKDFGDLNLTAWDWVVWMTTFLLGVVALKVLKRILVAGKFWVFGIYTLILSVLSLIYNLI